MAHCELYVAHSLLLGIFQPISSYWKHLMKRSRL